MNVGNISKMKEKNGKLPEVKVQTRICEDNKFRGEGESLQVLPDIAKCIAQKLSKALDKMLVEVVVDNSSSSPREVVEDDGMGIFLFSSSGGRISSGDIHRHEHPQRKQRKPKLKKKRHVDGSDSEDEDVKLAAVAVSADWVKSSTCY